MPAAARRFATLAVALGCRLAAPAIAQQGAVTGTVTDAASLAPVAGAQVFIAGTVIGTVTRAGGTYRLEGVPARDVEVTVRLIGYRETSISVSVRAGEIVTADFALEKTALKLQDIVVTGVVGETPRVKLPFTVERIDTTEQPAPASDVASMLAAQAAGVTVGATTGQPGATPEIMLRGPTSINSEGRSQSPLLVIDGVIQSENATLGDIGALDIDHVEIVKGAAAASLYGSRAQNGVIQITTRRGTGLPIGTTDFMMRGEYGMAELLGSAPFMHHHPYLMNEDGTKFIDTAGNEVEYLELQGGPLAGPEAGSEVLETGDPATSFADNPFPHAPRNQLALFYDPGETISVYGAVTGRSGGFSYRVSGDYYRERGIVDCGDACKNDLALENFGPDYAVKDDGFTRGNGRLNIDAQLGDLELAASGFYSRSSQDDVGMQTDAFWSLLNFTPYGDLTAHDEEGLPHPRADPLARAGNPLRRLATSEARNDRSRTMGSLDLRWHVTDWLSAEANASYDRTALAVEGLTSTRAGENEAGSLRRNGFDEEAANASITLAYAESFLDSRLTLRARARALTETQSFDSRSAEGNQFSVTDVGVFDAIEGPIVLENELTEIRSRGYFAIAGLDYGGRYILDGLVRRDGSSLFGPEQRWQTYGRGSVAWRVAQEPWWEVDWLEELKLRASVGSAGGRPNFYAHYETYEVRAGGIFPRVIGNTELRPERALEREVGLEIVTAGQLAVDLTYVWATIDDQILRVPQPAVTGFTERWANAGSLASRTWEASVRWSAIDRPDAGLNFRLNLDRTRADITSMNVPDYSDGLYFFADGEPVGEFWGSRSARNCVEVASSIGRFDTDGFDCSQFQVNDDGYMVYVGEGNDYTDGISKGLWGTQAEVDGSSFGWGVPVRVRQQNRSCLRDNPDDLGVGDQCPLVETVPIGNSLPDLNLAFATNVRWRGLTASFLVNGALGFDLYNTTRHGLWNPQRVEIDQFGKPDELKKPLGYYREDNNLEPAIEPGGWVKLREVAIGYTLPESFTRRVFGTVLDRVTISAIGRNLLTFTDYSGYDPEVGESGEAWGSAAIARYDYGWYPPSRTFSFALELVF